MRTLLVILALAGLCWGHGSTAPTPPPATGGPAWTGTPTAAPKGPSTGGPDSSPGGPSTPGGGTTGPATTDDGGRRAPPAEWRMWWERNREYSIGMRERLRRPTGTVTRSESTKPPVARDPIAGRRPDILATLRRLAVSAKDRSLRAAAVMALGRMGEDRDAMLFLELAKSSRAATGVREAALVALGILPPIRDTATREAVHEALVGFVNKPDRLPTRARGLAVCATGLRARDDQALVGALLARVQRRGQKTEDAANLAYALGLTLHPMVVPELTRAVVKAKFGPDKVTDIVRAHAVQALGLTGGPGAMRALCLLLRARSVRWETRRSAALAIGRLLWERDVSGDELALARKSLLSVIDKAPDYLLQGYAALALGSARKPLATRELKAAIESGTHIDIRPFCILALGLSVRSLEPDAPETKDVGAFLLKRLEATREPERAHSLSVALGMARAKAAVPLLLERLTRRSSNDQVRGAAAYGLGLMEARSLEVRKALEKIALEGRKPALLEEVVLALGLCGRRDIAPRMLDLLRGTNSSILQGRICVALGQLDHAATVEPLHTILRDERERTLVREFAATALAFMGDRRERDILFSLDAYHNLHATTIATHELLRLY